MLNKLQTAEGLLCVNLYTKAVPTFRLFFHFHMERRIPTQCFAQINTDNNNDPQSRPWRHLLRNLRTTRAKVSSPCRWAEAVRTGDCGSRRGKGRPPSFWITGSSRVPKSCWKRKDSLGRSRGGGGGGRSKGAG